jgi:acetyl-CoA acetyltransferase
MRDVAIVSFSQATFDQTRASESELLLPVLDDAVAKVGLTKQDIGFTCSGSTDYLAGQPFSFVAALDAVGPWPPISESHVEMDGAWALYEAWLWLQSGDSDTALVYAFGKTSSSDLSRTLALQLDPYAVGPLFPDSHSLAGLQARALIDAGLLAPQTNADAQTYAPLGPDDLPPTTDGAAAIVLAAGDRARELTDTPVWIRGIDHRIEPQALGLRDLTDSPSTRTAAEAAGHNGAPIDFAELHTRYPHEEVVLRRALGLDGSVPVNPSGGPRIADPFMATGLIRIGEAAQRLANGDGRRALAHATSGACLQQNLVSILEVA